MKLEPVALSAHMTDAQIYAGLFECDALERVGYSEEMLQVVRRLIDSAIHDGYVVVPVSKLGALELENKMLEAANEAAGKIESLLRQRLQDVRMYLLAEADKHTPRDPILGEAYQMTQRHLEWCPAAAKGQS